MNRANRRKTMFLEAADYVAFVELLREAGEKFKVHLLAFCLMPNHWHLVLLPSEGEAVSAYMRWLCGTHVRRYHKCHNLVGTGHLYQGRYVAIPVQPDGHLIIVLRYVEANPMRAGLVERAEDWPWSSLGASDEIVVGLLADSPVPRPANWLDWVNGPTVDLQPLRLALNRGAPFGSEEWKRRTADEHGLQFTLRPRGRPVKAEPTLL